MQRPIIREEVSIKGIRNLNKLSLFTEKNYANCYGNGGYWIECNFYDADGNDYRYRVNCRDEQEMHLLRAELDVDCKLVEVAGGRLMSCSK